MTTGIFDFEGSPHDVVATPQTAAIPQFSTIPLGSIRNHWRDKWLRETKEQIAKLTKEIEEVETQRDIEHKIIYGWEPMLGGVVTHD